MSPRLPSKDMLLQACSGIVSLPHPVLLATSELAGLHEARRTVDSSSPETSRVRADIDRMRAELVREIDRWVSAHKPTPLGAAYLHSETIGMVIDRVAEFSAAAHAALESDAAEPKKHYAWRRLSEVALAYADLTFEIHTGVRKLPDFTDPAAPQRKSEAQQHDRPRHGQ